MKLNLKTIASPRLQMLRRNMEMRSWRYSSLQTAIPHVTCIDVGASYYPHTSWWLFLGATNTQWIAVEPNVHNLEYLKKWPWKAKAKAVTQGLSEAGGGQTLFVTNQDSGSSLLEPQIPRSMKARLGVEGEKYFFPVQTVNIETITLQQILESTGNHPTVVKLDTQGTELSILKSAIKEPQQSRIVGIEIECSLLSEPLYKNSPRLWEVSLFLEKYGYELIGLDVLPRRQVTRKTSSAPRKLANECDAIFALRPDVILEKSVEDRATLFAFYITNNFYTEAILLYENDIEMVSYLISRGLNEAEVLSALRRK